jgi:uncharacterized membrane protein YfcA
LRGSLVAGSMPAIWLGAQLTRQIPEAMVSALLGLALTAAGIRVM